MWRFDRKERAGSGLFARDAFCRGWEFWLGKSRRFSQGSAVKTEQHESGPASRATSPYRVWDGSDVGRH
jgi:hypothetical protein